MFRLSLNITCYRVLKYRFEILHGRGVLVSENIPDQLEKGAVALEKNVSHGRDFPFSSVKLSISNFQEEREVWNKVGH